MSVSAEEVGNVTVADVEALEVEDRNCSAPLLNDGGTSDKVQSRAGEDTFKKYLKILQRLAKKCANLA